MRAAMNPIYPSVSLWKPFLFIGWEEDCPVEESENGNDGRLEKGGNTFRIRPSGDLEESLDVGNFRRHFGGDRGMEGGGECVCESLSFALQPPEGKREQLNGSLAVDVSTPTSNLNRRFVDFVCACGCASG